jgi:hypothetical protein
MLSVGPGRVMDEVALSEALSTMPRVLLEEEVPVLL